MNETQRDVVSFAAFESACTRLERANHRLFIIIGMLLIALIGTNSAWIYYESQWQTVESSTTTQMVSQDGESNRFIGGDAYGEAASDTD